VCFAPERRGGKEGTLPNTNLILDLSQISHIYTCPFLPAVLKYRMRTKRRGDDHQKKGGTCRLWGVTRRDRD
jgi:hypothetical protein